MVTNTHNPPTAHSPTAHPPIVHPPPATAHHYDVRPHPRYYVMSGMKLGNAEQKAGVEKTFLVIMAIHTAAALYGGFACADLGAAVSVYGLVRTPPTPRATTSADAATAIANANAAVATATATATTTASMAPPLLKYRVYCRLLLTPPRPPLLFAGHRSTTPSFWPTTAPLSRRWVRC